MAKELNIYLVSDSTGETIGLILRSVMSQFDSIKYNEKQFFMIRSEEQMYKICNDMKDSISNGIGCIVLYTILQDDLEGILLSECTSCNVLCIPAISNIVLSIANYLNVQNTKIVAHQHAIDNHYYLKMEAINYTIAHDDGNLSHDLWNADIILLGASRTSKTPTSIYLAYKGYKVANVPFVSAETMPSILFEIAQSQMERKPLIIGLVIEPSRLEIIRKSRIDSSFTTSNIDYADIDTIKEEIINSRKYFTKLGCHVINVTQKSVEESAVYILQMKVI